MIRRRDDATGGTTTAPPHHHRSSTCRDRHSAAGAGSPCAGRRRRCLAASALALCTVAFLLQDPLGRAEQTHPHGATAITPVESSGEPKAGAAKVEAKADAEIDQEILPYRLDDGGPVPPWKPPSERPIPLDAFPIFNGHGFKRNGNMDLVDVDVANGTGTAVLGSRNSGGGGGAVTDGDEGLGAGTEARAGTTSTLLFMHIWKCAGSSLRHLLRDWASLKGQEIGIVVRCTETVSQEKDKICLQRHALINETVQAPYIRLKQVVAGHFTWGFQKHVQQPYVMFTTLRNPLELFVSGQQYLNRKASKHFDHAVALVEETMMTVVKNHVLTGPVMTREGMGNAKSVGFLYRLVDPALSSQEGGGRGPKTLDEAASEAKEHLDTFWLVGVVEQYKGFIAVLKHMMDPLKRERKLWQQYAVGKYNSSPQGAGKVLAAIEPGLVEQFNATLSHQWEVYSYAVGLYKHRCKQMLHTRDLELCEVPVAPSQYTFTEMEREELQLEHRAGVTRKPQPRDGGVLTGLEREELELEKQELRLQEQLEDGDGDESVLGDLERVKLQLQRKELQQQDGSVDA